MHDGMLYDPINVKVKVKVMGLLKFRKLRFSRSIISNLLCHLQWVLASDHRFLK